MSPSKFPWQVLLQVSAPHSRCSESLALRVYGDLNHHHYLSWECPTPFKGRIGYLCHFTGEETEPKVTDQEVGEGSRF